MQRIQTKTLHQQVADQIRELIRIGTLEVGQKINEKSLCDSMGVSRTPVREALRILHSEGLIDLIANRGAFVSQPCIEEISDMFQVMSVLEGMCARLATERMTLEDVHRLEAIHRELECYFLERNHEAYLESNQRFHVLVQALSGNRVLHDVINGLRRKILLYRHRQLYQPKRFEASIQEHRDLLEAFRRRDTPRAEALMKRHLLKQCEALVDLYAGGRDAEHKKAASSRDAPIP
jgi:DNA-binding GntR family transcriptional regulator